MHAEGTSNNIDKYASRKFDALKEYATRHPEIKWGLTTGQTGTYGSR